MKIGEQIMVLRKQKGLTQAELGRLVGVSSQAVSKWESGGAPDVEMLPSIATALGVTIDTLFGREKEETENITAVTARWLSSVPVKRRLWELYRLLMNTFSCACWEGDFDPEAWQEEINDRRLLDSCFQTDAQGTTWIRSIVESEEGLALGIPGRNFPMYLLLPEPEGAMGQIYPSPKGIVGCSAAWPSPGFWSCCCAF